MAASAVCFLSSHSHPAHDRHGLKACLWWCAWRTYWRCDLRVLPLIATRLHHPVRTGLLRCILIIHPDRYHDLWRTPVWAIFVYTLLVAILI